jgi:hypothetical protein
VAFRNLATPPAQLAAQAAQLRTARNDLEELILAGDTLTNGATAPAVSMALQNALATQNGINLFLESYGADPVPESLARTVHRELIKLQLALIYGVPVSQIQEV